MMLDLFIKLMKILGILPLHIILTRLS